MEDDEEFDPQFEMNVPGKGIPKFHSFAEVANWAAQEQEAFSFKKRPSLPWYGSAVSDYEQRYAAIEQAARGASNPKEPKEVIERYQGDLLRQFVNLAKSNYANSRTVIGKKIISLKDSDPDLAAAMMMLNCDLPIKPADRAINFRPLVKAQEVICRLEMGDQEGIGYSKEIFDDLMEEYSEKFDDHNNQMASHVREGDTRSAELTTLFEDQSAQHAQLTQLHRETMEAIRTEFEKDKQALKTSYSEELKLRSASDYWSKKATTHRKAFWLWAGLFIVVSVVGAIAVVTFGQEVIGNALPNAGSLAIGNLVVVTIPALVLFWTMRMVSRFVLNNMRRLDDAAERQLMIMTYLALLAEAESQVTEDERILLLNAIFRPGPGEIREEGESNLLTELVRSQRSPGAG